MDKPSKMPNLCNTSKKMEGTKLRFVKLDQ